jgi:hypothetical protein
MSLLISTTAIKLELTIYMGFFKENREEEKWRGKENNGRGRLKGRRPRAEG